MWESLCAGVWACVRVCVSVCVCVCAMGVGVSVCAGVWVWKSLYAGVWACGCVCASVCVLCGRVCVCRCVDVGVCVCRCVDVDVNMYVYIIIYSSIYGLFSPSLSLPSSHHLLISCLLQLKSLHPFAFGDSASDHSKMQEFVRQLQEVETHSTEYVKSVTYIPSHTHTHIHWTRYVVTCYRRKLNPCISCFVWLFTV